MRLAILPMFLAAASVATLVSAEPIRVIESASDANAKIRFGHALANANVNGNDDDIVRHAVIVKPSPEAPKNGIAHHLCGGSLRDKALRLSNAFRHALGLPLIEADLEVPRPGQIHILPMGYPSHNVMLQGQDDDEDAGKHRKHHGGEGDHGHHGRHGHHGHHGHHGKHPKNFLRRIHRAIMALGPWEGRAVAFVLGCGIGVLLRMFWVLSVLAYRTVRGEREETFDREYIVYEQVPETFSETLYVAPPQYGDEKIRVDVEEEQK